MATKRKPTRKTAKWPKETGVIKKTRGDRTAVALVYPNSYELAMGNLGFHQVYHLMNMRDDVVCERAVWTPESAVPRTIESDSPLSDFEILAFSVSYEIDAANMIALIKKLGIPPTAKGRAAENAPLVMAGGVMCFMNPEPIAPFCDAIAIGEAEAIIPAMFDTYRKFRSSERDKLLDGLSSVPGVYVPSLYRMDYGSDLGIEARSPINGGPPKVHRMVCDNLGEDPARTRVFTEKAEFSDMALIELSRGCTHACRFCAGAFVYRPPRWTPVEAAESALSERLQHREKAGLVAASATDHPWFNRIRGHVKEMGKAHSVASLRLDQVTPELLDDIRDSGHRTLTLAPEAATERLRSAINKPMSNTVVLAAARMAGASNIPRLKLYFQVGLPHETDEDVESIPPFIALIKAGLSEGAGTRNWATSLTVSANPFVAKPGTPFQWHTMASGKDMKAKLEYLKRELKRLGGVSFSGTSPREALVQGLIARGDRRTGLELWERAGKRGYPYSILKVAPQYCPSPEWYIHRLRTKDEELPWDFIDHRVSKNVLWHEYEKSMIARTTPACRPGKCRNCDACLTAV